MVLKGEYARHVTSLGPQTFTDLFLAHQGNPIRRELSGRFGLLPSLAPSFCFCISQFENDRFSNKCRGESVYPFEFGLCYVLFMHASDTRAHSCDGEQSLTLQ